MRRFELPIAVLVLAAAFLLARLYDVQVTQHPTWAREAANLVRSYHIEPYRRGALRDRNGVVIARDEEVYQLEFVWRDFRRGHPLGQVAMAWSTALGSPLALDDARRDLEMRAGALVALTPGAVRAFGRGAALELGPYGVLPAAEDERAGDLGGAFTRDEAALALRRRTRAGDLAYYVLRLLALSEREERELRRLVDDGGLAESSYLSLAATVTGVAEAEVARALAGRLAEAERHLARLADELDWGDTAAPPGLDPRTFERLAPLDKLLAVVEARRVDVDDDTADAMFQAAVGAPPWRFDQANLARFDLAWLDPLLGWDAARRHAWLLRRGAAFPAMVEDWLAGHVIARAKLAVREADAAPTDALLASLAHAFRADAEEWARQSGVPEDWRNVDELEGLAGLDVALQRGAELDTRLLRDALPFQAAAARRSKAADEDLLLEVLGARLGPLVPVLEAARNGLPNRWRQGPPITPLRVARFLAELAASPRRDWDRVDRDLAAGLVLALESDLQRRITEVLSGLQGPDGAPLALRAEARGRAEESRRYIVRDRGSRPRIVGREPSYELVHLVTRHPREFAGFNVRPLTRRVRPHAAASGKNHHPDGLEVAAFLVGEVRHPYLVDLLRQRPGEVELAEMQQKLALPDEDREAILELVQSAWHAGERMGGSGLEGWFDPELRGREGYSEFQGLQDRKSANRAPIHQPAIDGQDVWLTLDLDLQRAAEALLRAPRVPDDPKTDPYWFMNPVGALVLATVDGDVLVAASTPLVPGLAPAPDTDGERRNALDRTLRRPKGEPPGSVMKPIFALAALQHASVGFDEGLVVCSTHVPREGADAKRSRMPGYGKVDCNVSAGHSILFGPAELHRVTMAQALVVSCNTYFAALGERHFDGGSMRATLELFGFGQPTGVRYAPDGRSGLVENSAFGDRTAFPPGGGPATPGMRQYVSNGLVHLNVNVVQIARAYAGIATGALPTMRVVRRIGAEDLPAETTPLPIDAVHFERVRGALRMVVARRGGSAFDRGLSDAELGFSLAGKTGSADYRSIPEGESEIQGRTEGYMRKHAWFAGYFPHAAPRYVVVAYLHDTAATAGHSATYLTSQFLRLPEVQAYLKRELAR